jgi:hypothetical protein
VAQVEQDFLTLVLLMLAVAVVVAEAVLLLVALAVAVAVLVLRELTELPIQVVAVVEQVESVLLLAIAPLAVQE